MPVSLPLAIDILEAAEAPRRLDRLDLEAEAERLMRAHPEAEASRKQGDRAPAGGAGGGRMCSAVGGQARSVKRGSMFSVSMLSM